jgi:ribonuclease P protein component
MPCSILHESCIPGSALLKLHYARLDPPEIEPTRMTTRAITFRLRKHADYQRVYKASRKQFAKQMTYFFTLRPQLGPDGTPLRDADTASPRIGLTVGKVMGKAVDRNRIKRRMREAVRKNLSTLSAPVDVILHPRRTVIDLEFSTLEREVANVFRAIQKATEKAPAKPNEKLREASSTQYDPPTDARP